VRAREEDPGGGSRGGEGPRILSRPVVSWALYDLANTMFSMNIVSFFLSLWVVNVMGGSDGQWAYTLTVSYAIIFVASPFLGALTDQAPRRMPFLVASTLVCVATTAMLGWGGVGTTLVLLVVANVAYQAGLQFYDALLPEVSTPSNRGRVGAMGIGLGYAGSFVGVALGGLLLSDVDLLATAEEKTVRFRWVFQMTAVLFLLAAIPCFLFVKERVRSRPPFRLGALRAAGGQVMETFRTVGRFPGLGRFLVGRAIYTDAINTVILFMGIYVVEEVGFSTQGATNVMLVAIAFAVVAGFLWGPVVDRVGPRKALNRALGIWVVVFALAAAVGILGLPGTVFWVVPVLAGVALAGTWSADRPFMLRLTPGDRVGEFYGLYGMVGRFSAITGPLAWGFMVDTLGWSRPVVILTLLAEILLAWWILRTVSDRPLPDSPDAPPGLRSPAASD